jgi:sugar phosphate isomerase/epimerase
VSEPRFSISTITTLHSPFEDDLRIYEQAGATGVGIWELKLGDGSLEAFEPSGLESTNAVPNVASIGAWPIGGPDDPRERVVAFCASLRRLAPFQPSVVVLLTGVADRLVIVDGLRTIAAEARALGLRIGLEPYSRFEGEQWSIVHTIRDAVALIDETGVAADVGVMFDVWHLWDDPGVEDDIAAHIDRIAGVHVCDWREPTRGFADRVLPGDGAADVPRLLGALDRAGWAGFYDLEIFSDNGAFGSAYPDSLWDVPPDQLARRGREAFLACWERRR